jgi:hypothetical protein
VIDDEGAFMFSSSSDGTIKKWALTSENGATEGQVVATFEGHLTSVYSLYLNDGMLWSSK